MLAIGLWGAAAIGYLLGPLSWPERAFATAAGFLVAALPSPTRSASRSPAFPRLALATGPPRGADRRERALPRQDGACVTSPLAAFTLAWTHSVERVAGRRTGAIEGDRWSLVEARVRGSGAGMEPPPEAVLRRRLVPLPAASRTAAGR